MAFFEFSGSWFPNKYVLFTVWNFGMKALANGRKMNVGDMNDIKKYERLNRISTRSYQKIPFKLPVFSIYVVSICILSGWTYRNIHVTTQKTPRSCFVFTRIFAGKIFCTLQKSQRGMSRLVYFPVAISCATATVWAAIHPVSRVGSGWPIMREGLACSSILVAGWISCHLAILGNHRLCRKSSLYICQRFSQHEVGPDFRVTPENSHSWASDHPLPAPHGRWSEALKCLMVKWESPPNECMKMPDNYLCPNKIHLNPPEKHAYHKHPQASNSSIRSTYPSNRPNQIKSIINSTPKNLG